MVEVRVEEVRMEEVRMEEVRMEEVRMEEVRVEEVGSSGNISLSEVAPMLLAVDAGAVEGSSSCHQGGFRSCHQGGFPVVPSRGVLGRAITACASRRVPSRWVSSRRVRDHH